MNKSVIWMLRLGVFVLCFQGALSASAAFKQYGDAELNTIDGIYVIHSKGDDYTMAYDSSHLYGAEVMEGMVPYMGTKITNLLVGVIPIDLPEFLITFLTDWFFNDPLINTLGQRELDMLRGISEGTTDAGYELPLGMVQRGYVAPEVVHLLINTAVEIGLVPGKLGTQNFGCSSVIALPEFTGSDKTLFIRGQDYPGLGRFDAFPSINYVEPEEGYRFVSINSLGMSTLPLTAVNEHGLAIAIHVTISSDVSSDGKVVFGVIEDMMRKAKTIEEAYAFVEGVKHVSGWQVHITDIFEGKRRAAVIELSSNNTALLMREGYSILTNRHYSEKLQEHEIYVSKGTFNHNINREVRLNQLMAQYKGNIDVERGVEILRDNYDVESNKWVSFSPNIVGTVDQIKAVVMELGDSPADTTIWVANGMAPASQGSFYAFPFETFFQGDAVHADDLQSIGARLRSEASAESPGFAGYEDYKTAFLAYDEESDPVKALEYMRLALAKDNSDWFRLGVALLTMRQGNVDEAHALLARLVESEELGPHHKLMSKLYLGMTYELLGNPEEAAVHYSELAETKDIDPFLKESAQHWLEEDFTMDDANSVSPDLKYFEDFGYGV